MSVQVERPNYWTWLLSSEFAEKDRNAVNLKRDYSTNQIEYCRNFSNALPHPEDIWVFLRNGTFRLTADKVAYIFGVSVTKRLRGKLQSVLEELDHGHHLKRIYCKNLWAFNGEWNYTHD